MTDYNTLVYTEQGGDKMVVKSGGTIEAQSGATIDAQSGSTVNIVGLGISVTEAGFIDGVTAGTAAASKAVVLDANKDCGDVRNFDVTNLDAGKSGTAGTVDVFPTTASKGKMTISCADQTGDTTFTLEPAAHGQATKLVIPDGGQATAYAVQSTAALTLAEVDVLDAVTAGTVAASKAVVVDSNKDIGDFRNLDCVNLDAGASGTAGTVDIFPTTANKGKLSLACTDQTGDTTVTINANAMGQGTTVNIADPGGAASYMVQSTAALTLAEVDVLDAVTPGTVAASKAVVVDANLDIASFRNVTLTGKLNLGINGGAASASGLLMGVGTTANPAATAAADTKFVEIRTKSTATSGDSRNIWLRHDIGGAGGSGECFRAITDLTAAAATARGAQISLQPDDTGYVTGLGVGVDSQLLFGNASLAAGGTYAALNAEVYSAGSSTDVSGCTKLSFLRFVNGGDATGAATVDGKAFLMELSGFTAGANVTDTISSTSLAELPANTIGLAIDVGGTRYYIPAVVSTEWN